MSLNYLANEPSPYLRQHAANPVCWYPWGESALALARSQDKPILLSVGYSACHWCHVMAHESFEDPALAALVNAHFVAIKVDREERPDLDQVYQTVCQLLTHSGGWPLTVFLTPAGEPFYAGTYFPPTPRWGRPGFGELCLALAEAYRDQREQVAQQAERLLAALAATQVARPAGTLPAKLLDTACADLLGHFDSTHGGFGGAPKFPNPCLLELLLRQPAEPAPARVLQTLRALRSGGIYDQLGGGFHRYSVDAAWQIPHFEKMLYDNALLVPLYLAAWQRHGHDDLAQTARETLDCLLRDFAAPGGAFYAATDADSEGVEGRYFVWTPAQLAEVLEPPLARAVGDWFGVSASGNFEHGTTCLHLATPDADPPAGLAEARARLLAARDRRVPPALDDKLLATWNGLALRAFARAALVLDDERYLAAARRLGDFLLTDLQPDGRLARFAKDGRAYGRGFLDDHANVALGLLELFGADAQPRWLEGARALVETILADFLDPAVGDYFMTPAEGEALVLRPKDLHDHAVPSGLSSAVHALLGLWALTAEPRYRDAAERAVLAHADALTDHAWDRASLLAAADALGREPRCLVLVGDVAELQAVAVRCADPDLRVLRVAHPAPTGLPESLAHPEPGAWLCGPSGCRPPMYDPAALAALLDS